MKRKVVFALIATLTLTAGSMGTVFATNDYRSPDTDVVTENAEESHEGMQWVVDSPAVYEDQWVVDKEAVYEQQWIVDKEAVYETVHHEAVYETVIEYQPAPVYATAAIYYTFGCRTCGDYQEFTSYSECSDYIHKHIEETSHGNWYQSFREEYDYNHIIGFDPTNLIPVEVEKEVTPAYDEEVLVSPEEGHYENVLVSPEEGHWESVLVQEEIGHWEPIAEEPGTDDPTVEEPETPGTDDPTTEEPETPDTDDNSGDQTETPSEDEAQTSDKNEQEQTDNSKQETAETNQVQNNNNTSAATEEKANTATTVSNEDKAPKTGDTASLIYLATLAGSAVTGGTAFGLRKKFKK